VTYLHRILAFLLVLALWSTPALAVGPVGGGGAPGWTQIYGIQPRPEMHYLPYHADATSAEGAQTWTRFLINDLPGIDGPGWDLLECRITLGGAGRLVPADSHDLDSLPGAAVALATNDDWCVLRALTGDGGTRWVLYVELQSAAAINVAVCPLDNWATGGADASPPAWMAGCFGGGVGLLTAAGTLISFPSGNGNYSAIADVSMVQLFTDIGGIVRWGYFGELDGCGTDRTTPDTRCFVAFDEPTISRSYGAQTAFNRLSPVDSATALNDGRMDVPTTSAVTTSVITQTLDTQLGGQQSWPLFIQFFLAGHDHVAGKLRACAGMASDVGAVGQTADLCTLAVSSAAGANTGLLVLPWDCATAYPGAAAITISHGGWKAVPADWIVPEGGNL